MCVFVCVCIDGITLHTATYLTYCEFIIRTCTLTINFIHSFIHLFIHINSLSGFVTE